MFIVKLKDRNGRPLRLGDIVKISDGKRITFFVRVTWLPEIKKLVPFHTFSFHSIEYVGDNVEVLPDGIVQCVEPRFDCWFMPGTNLDASAKAHEQYLMEWRKCENVLESCYDIELI